MGGASGYLLKQIRGTSLVDAVRQVAAGRSLLDPAVTERLLTRLRQGTETDPRLAALSDREREILGLIADGLHQSGGVPSDPSVSRTPYRQAESKVPSNPGVWTNMEPPHHEHDDDGAFSGGDIS
jgi:hypothetical protein